MLQSFIGEGLVVDKTIHNDQQNQIERYKNDSEINQAKFRCSFFGYSPNFLQSFLTPKWLLFWLCCASALQGFIVNGLVNVTLSTIERRYQLKASELAVIASGYDVASILLLIPVSFFGETRNKPCFIGIGMMVMSFGALVFSLPYFFSGKYHFSHVNELNCPQLANSTRCSSSGISSVSQYKWIFFFGQYLHGAGATPLYTLGCALINENVSKKMSSVYLAIYYTTAIVGPGIGYILGGQILNIYVDWMFVDPTTLGLTSDSSVWIGSWWIGFIFGSLLTFIVAFPILAFPKTLPDSAKLQIDKNIEVHSYANISKAMKKDFGAKIKDLPVSLKILFQNPTFMFLNLAGACEGLLTSGLATYMPKYFEQQFSLSPSISSVLVGIASLPGAGGGTFFGGYLVKHYNLKCKSILKFCMISSMIGCLMFGTFIISCDRVKFAGLSTFYHDQPNVHLNLSLISNCNSHCKCLEYDYNPICGIDNIMYYSSCHAGCLSSYYVKGTQIYTNCSCIKVDNEANRLNFGKFDFSNKEIEVEAIRSNCQTSCHLLSFFCILTFCAIFCTFLVSMPSLTATLRCIAASQRSLGLGVQWILVRGLGTIPSAFIFGKLLDQCCIHWNKQCNGDSDACIIYDNQKLSSYMFFLTVFIKFLSFTFFTLSWYLYKPPKNVQDEKGEELEDL